MTREERNNKLKHLITCMKCEVSGKCCDENCPTQYDAGNMGEIIENLEEISKILEQEPTLDKIKAEIDSLHNGCGLFNDGVDASLKIIDKYRNGEQKMTKEEREKAIDLLDNLIGMIADNQKNDYDKALRMGIKALEQEPCEDAVSKQAVIKAVDAHTFDTDKGLCLDDDISCILEELPSVTPIQRWIPCSENGDENNGKI